jgi:serine/threonine protein kinase
VLGEVVGSYQITGKIAEGGMGVVYRAQHQLLGKPAAVKILLPELSSNHELVNRFFNEARAATSVRHPGIVEIFDFGYMSNGVAYLVMELLEGEPLSRRLLTRGHLEERESLVLMRGIASALAAAHGQGIIHRDLKPDNIFLIPDPDMPTGERPKLLDFGIAKIAEAQRGGASAKTRTGAVMGTPTYMSPEQCRGAGEIDHRSDLYALGCILYEMVTGRPPFQSEGIGELIAFHMFMQPEPPSRLVAGLSSQTEALIMRLLAKKPEDRLGSAAELARLLGQGSIPMLGSVTAQTVAMQPLLTPLPPSTTQNGQGQGHGPMGGTAPGIPTTLSGAAGQAGGTLTTGVDQPFKKSKAPLFAGLAVVLVGGGIAAGVLAGGGKKPAAAAVGGIDPVPPAVVIDAGAQVAEPTATPDAAPAAVPAVVIDAGVELAVTVDAAPAETPPPTPVAATGHRHATTHHETVKPTGHTTTKPPPEHQPDESSTDPGKKRVDRGD